MNRLHASEQLRDDWTITVCDACMQASCWQGIFMCDRSRGAGTMEISIGRAKQLKLEHPDYWRSDESIKARFA